jgi:hypothetical protein
MPGPEPYYALAIALCYQLCDRALSTDDTAMTPPTSNSQADTPSASLAALIAAQSDPAARCPKCGHAGGHGPGGICIGCPCPSWHGPQAPANSAAPCAPASNKRPLFETLLANVSDTQFDCGDHDESDSDEPYTAVRDRAIAAESAMRAFVRSLESRLAAAEAVAAKLRVARDAWRDYAEHAAGCVECGETSWENCDDTSSHLGGKTLRGAAVDADARAAAHVATVR